MQLYCPSCKTSVPSADRCSQCGDRLVTPSELFASSSELGATPPPLLRPTPIGRAAVGTVITIGIYIGLREEALGVMTFLGYDTTTTNTTTATNATAIALTLTLRTISLMVGGLFAGAGRTHSLLTGWLTGLACGGLLLATDILAGHKPTTLDWVSVAAMAVVAAGASAIGCRIWPPVVDIPVPMTNPRGSSLARLANQDDQEQTAPPTAWVRLCFAVALGVALFALSDPIRLEIKKMPNGIINLGSPAMAPTIDFLFSILGLGLAGTIAGGNTGAGLRHGFYYGLATASIVTGSLLAGNAAVRHPVVGFLECIGVGVESIRNHQPVMFLFVTLLVNGLIWGAFGSILLPRVAPKWRRPRLLEQS